MGKKEKKDLDSQEEIVESVVEEIVAQKYAITITGLTPLILHKDDYSWSDKISKWTKQRENKDISVNGDDRSPAWTWLGKCYVANDLIVVESDNIMALLREAGKKCPAVKGRGSLKAITQSGIVVNEIGWPIVTPKGTVKYSPIKEKLENNNDFSIHEQVAIENGFFLFVKRARIGKSKHIRVRPRFDSWSVSGTITVINKTLSKATIEELFYVAGSLVGMCDWRPGSPESPGNFGMFKSHIEEI